LKIFLKIKKIFRKTLRIHYVRDCIGCVQQSNEAVSAKLQWTLIDSLLWLVSTFRSNEDL